MNITRNSQDTINHGKAVHSSVRHRPVLILILAVSIFCGQDLTFQTSIVFADSGATTTESPEGIVKRPLPGRAASQEQKAVAAEPEKKPAAAASQSVPAEKKTDVSTSEVKKPLPARASATDPKLPVVKAEEKKAVPAEKPQPAPAVSTTGAVEGSEKRPLPRHAVPVSEPAKVVVNKQPDAAQRPTVSVANKSEATAQAKKSAPVSAAGAEKMPQLVKKTANNPKSKPILDASVPSSGVWTVMVGNYLLDDVLATDMSKVKKAGLIGSVKPGARQKTLMSRLLLAEFDNRGAAQVALEKLKQHTDDAFILDHGGKHTVYAGSYVRDRRAAFEKERLGSAGFELTLKQAEVAIPSKNLYAGSFADKKTAEATLNKLTALGIKATLVQQ